MGSGMGDGWQQAKSSLQHVFFCREKINPVAFRDKPPVLLQQHHTATLQLPKPLPTHNNTQVLQAVCGRGIPPSTQLAEHCILLQQQGSLPHGRLLALDMLTPASRKWLAAHGVLTDDAESAAMAVKRAHLGGGALSIGPATTEGEELMQWLPAEDPQGQWNIPALCAAQRVAAAGGRVGRMPLREVLARLRDT